MNFEVVPASELPFTEQAATFTAAFAGYLAGSMEMDAAGLARFISLQGADLFYSRFVKDRNGALAGFGYINRTANVPRLAAMGTIPAARRTGAATHLLAHLLDEARARHDQAMVLEVFEQNGPAHALYQRHGFRELTRLFGWRHQNEAAGAKRNDLRELNLLSVLQMNSAPAFPEIPWQISRHIVAKLSAVRAFSLGRIAVVVGDPAVPPVRVHAFLGEEDWRERKDLMSALCAEFPGCGFFAPPIFPENFGNEIFAPLGFVREPLNQFLMRRDL